ncbi:MAG: ArnT family glycosyltransferase, partial [Bryobacteraceae bacterium]
SMYMLDLPVALFSLWALLQEIRYFKAPDRSRHAIGYALCASLAFLTKFSGAFVFLFPVVLVLGTRKWSLLRNKWFWAQPAIVAALCGPWVLYTHRLMYVGLPSGGTPIHRHLALAVAAFLLEFLRFAGPVLVASAVAGMLMMAVKRRWNAELFMYAAAPLCVILLLVASPVDPERRQFLPMIAPLILLIAYSCERLKVSKMRVLGIAVPAVLVVAGAVKCAMAFPHFLPDRLRPLVEYVDANPNWRNASILLPPDCEGPAIAEFAEYAPHRPDHTLLRPSKIVGISDWWGISQTRFSGAAQFEKALAANPIGLIVVDRMRTVKSPVGRVIDATAAKYPAEWVHVAMIRSRCGRGICGLWDVYASKKASISGVRAVFRKRTLGRYAVWRKQEK